MERRVPFLAGRMYVLLSRLLSIGIVRLPSTLKSSEYLRRSCPDVPLAAFFPSYAFCVLPYKKRGPADISIHLPER